MRSNTDRILDIIDAAVAGSAPFLPVRLVVFPEFAHSAPVFPTVRELLRQLTVPIPNEHSPAERMSTTRRFTDDPVAEIVPQYGEQLLSRVSESCPRLGVCACNRVQGATATLAFTATVAL